MMVAAPPVVVLKQQPYPLFAGTIGIARSLGRLGVEVRVIGEQSWSPVARSRYVRSTSGQLPMLSSPEQLALWLREVAPEGKPLLLPVDDLGAVFVQQQADILLDAYQYPRLPDGLAGKLVDKLTLAALARSAGLKAPLQAVASTPEQVDMFLAETDFPVVVKMRDPDLAARTPGVRSVEIANNAADVRKFWSRHLVDRHPNCLLQEYIPGGPETVWMVNAYSDDHSMLRFASSGRKLRQYPPYTGATSLGVIECNDEVLSLTAQLIQHIGYRGILDIGWRFDARDGTYKLLDFNPRIGATFRLFVGERGLDVARACYFHMMEGAVPVDEVRDGRKWINDSYDMFSAARYIRDGNLKTAEYFRSLHRVDEAAWLSWKDPQPALSVLKMTTKRALSYGAGQVRNVWSRNAAEVHRSRQQE